MDDPDDPLISPRDVPSFEIVEEKIKEIDNAIIVFRIYYFFNTRIFRFQLMKKDKMCIIEFPRRLLENLSKDGTSSQRELSKILDLNIENSESWSDVQ